MKIDFEVGLKIFKFVSETIEAVEAQFNNSLTGEQKKNEVIDSVDAGLDVIFDQINIHPDLRNSLKESVPVTIELIMKSINSVKGIMQKSIF